MPVIAVAPVVFGIAVESVMSGIAIAPVVFGIAGISSMVPFIVAVIVTANMVFFVDMMASMTANMVTPARHVGNLFASLEERSG